MRLRLSSLALAAGLLALPACDLFGPNPGSFEVDVEGEVAASFSGEPVTFINPVETSDPSERTYQFRFAASGNERVVTVEAVSDGGAELSEGEYPIGRFGLDLGPGRAEATAFLDQGDFLSRSGALTLTEVTGNRVRGSFEFEAVGDEGEVTVWGTFEADLNENAGRSNLRAVARVAEPAAARRPKRPRPRAVSNPTYPALRLTALPSASGA